MPRATPFCPAHRLFVRAAVLFCGTVFWAPTALSASEQQNWSVHAYGLKVGELSLSGSQAAGQFSGTGRFQTTGLASALRRIRFNVKSNGKMRGTDILPTQYEGHIDTGRRVSKTALTFSGGVPQKVAGAQSPAVPISNKAKRGAVDPMTMMWLSLRDQSPTTLCTLRQTQFDGTRLVRITLKERKDDDTGVTCSGTYNRIGGYTKDELAEMTISPVAVRYVQEGAVWTAQEVSVTTRHGRAKLHRQN